MGRGYVVCVIPTVRATRYVTPLREGGSLPGLVEAEDWGTYVCKFRGAGQGIRVLVAEVIVSSLAQRLSVETPRLVALELPGELARYEADQEVQDLLRASVGLNLGVDFLPGSFGFGSSTKVTPEEAARILWLDAFTANVDRSWRNPNLLVWHGRLIAIDHGAALYFHHGWSNGPTDPARFAAQPYNVDDHVFTTHADLMRRLAPDLAVEVGGDAIAWAVDQVPLEWLEAVAPGSTAEEAGAAYRTFLSARLESFRVWLPREGAA